MNRKLSYLLEFHSIPSATQSSRNISIIIWLIKRDFLLHNFRSLTKLFFSLLARHSRSPRNRQRDQRNTIECEQVHDFLNQFSLDKIFHFSLYNNSSRSTEFDSHSISCAKNSKIRTRISTRYSLDRVFVHNWINVGHDEAHNWAKRWARREKNISRMWMYLRPEKCFDVQSNVEGVLIVCGERNWSNMWTEWVKIERVQHSTGLRVVYSPHENWLYNFLLAMVLRWLAQSTRRFKFKVFRERRREVSKENERKLIKMLAYKPSSLTTRPTSARESFFFPFCLCWVDLIWTLRHQHTPDSNLCWCCAERRRCWCWWSPKRRSEKRNKKWMKKKDSLRWAKNRFRRFSTRWSFFSEKSSRGKILYSKLTHFFSSSSWPSITQFLRRVDCVWVRVDQNFDDFTLKSSRGLVKLTIE